MVIIIDVSVEVPKVFENCTVHLINLEDIHSIDTDIEYVALTIYKKVVETGADLVILSNKDIAERLREEDITVYLEKVR